jgi:hypothetical protein
VKGLLLIHWCAGTQRHEIRCPACMQVLSSQRAPGPHKVVVICGSAGSQPRAVGKHRGEVVGRAAGNPAESEASVVLQANTRWMGRKRAQSSMTGWLGGREASRHPDEASASHLRLA